MTPALILTLVVAVAANFIPMVYRLATPVPESDHNAIELFLKEREQTLVQIRKRWIGGPSPQYGARSFVQIGRPYRVLARSGDGLQWKHDLATVPADHIGGNRQLVERSYGVWMPVRQR